MTYLVLNENGYRETITTNVEDLEQYIINDNYEIIEMGSLDE